MREDSNDKLELHWTDEALRAVGRRFPGHVASAADVGAGQGPAPGTGEGLHDGLLPEGHARTNYAIEAGLRPEDTFGLVSRYGRDTAGALVFQPVGEPAPLRVGQYRALTDKDVGQRLRHAHRHVPDFDQDRGRDSSTLAGLQPKITLHRADDGAWQACLDGAPSTWIVKLAQPFDGPSGDVVDTEWVLGGVVTQAALAGVGQPRETVPRSWSVSKSQAINGSVAFTVFPAGSWGGNTRRSRRNRRSARSAERDSERVAGAVSVDMSERAPRAPGPGVFSAPQPDQATSPWLDEGVGVPDKTGASPERRMDIDAGPPSCSSRAAPRNQGVIAAAAAVTLCRDERGVGMLNRIIYRFLRQQLR